LGIEHVEGSGCVDARVLDSSLNHSYSLMLMVDSGSGFAMQGVALVMVDAMLQRELCRELEKCRVVLHSVLLLCKSVYI
jgi:hypothetical protein